MVTEVNDFPTTSADGLIAATRFYAPGTKVTITYTRDGAKQTADGHPRQPLTHRSPQPWILPHPGIAGTAQTAA